MTDQIDTGRVVACCWIPGFELGLLIHRARVASDQPAVLVRGDSDSGASVLECNPAAEAQGVQSGVSLAEAFGCAPQLVVLERDQLLLETAAERFIERIENLGAAVHPIEPGKVWFNASSLQLLYGGLEGVFTKILSSIRSQNVRIGAAPNPFVALVAAHKASARTWLHVPPASVCELLDSMPLKVLPADPDLLSVLRALGLETLGDFAAIAKEKVADRFGKHGLAMHQLAQGIDDSRLVTRVPSAPVLESIVFPEAVASSVTFDSALRHLSERLVEHHHCEKFAPSVIKVICVLAEGSGSWQAVRTMRKPVVDAERIALTISPALNELPAAIEQITLQLEAFVPRLTMQRDLFAVGDESQAVREGVRHVQEALGEDVLLKVLEVDPRSRIIERRAALVPMNLMQQEVPE